MTLEREQQLRLFVAIELSPDWLEALEKARANLRTALEKIGAPQLRWVRPEGVHLTLKFLGAVPQVRLPSVMSALDSATRPPPRFALVLTRAGSFGDRRGPRVLWAGVDGATVDDRKALYGLVDRIETWFASADFPREQRFHPHLTLARVPEKLSREERALVATATGDGAELQAAPFVVASISLMRSHLGPGGARYERLASFPTHEA
jgi:2'-5' RNA ligase